MLATFRVALERSSGGLLAAFAVITVGRLIFQTPQWVVSYVQYDAVQTGRAAAEAGGYGVASICTLVLQVAGEVLIGAFAVGLYRTVRRLLVEGPGAPGSAFEVLRASSRRYAHSMAAYLLVVVATAAGALICCVGALASIFFVGLVPYLVAAREHTVADAVRRSIELARANVTAMAVAVVAVVVAAVVVVGVDAGLGALLPSLFGAVGVFLADALAFIVGAAVGYVLLVFWGALGVTLDEAALSR